MSYLETPLAMSEVPILLNEAYLSGERFIDIVYPFLDLKILTLDLERFEMRGAVDFEAYGRASSSVPDLLAKDIPRFSDLRQVLISSGVMGFTNWYDVRTDLLHHMKETRNIRSSRRVMYLSVDTNILYFRHVSRRMMPRGRAPPPVPDAGSFRWAVSEVVMNEVDRHIRRKYGRRHIDAFRRMSHPHLADRLFNMGMRPTRMAKSAFLELDHILTRLEAVQVKGRMFPRDKEERDILIVKSLREFEERWGCDVLLLSADEDMPFHARNCGISCEVLHVPHVTPDSARLTPDVCMYLLHDLALMFGCVMLRGTGTILYGAWGGMTGSDWVDGSLLALVERGARVQEGLARSLEVSRNIRRRVEVGRP